LIPFPEKCGLTISVDQDANIAFAHCDGLVAATVGLAAIESVWLGIDNMGMTMSMTGSKVRRTQTERSDETRRRVLDAAIEVLKQRGYAGFRIAEVANVAGVSRGAQSHHFPAKDALLLEALDHIYSRAKERALDRIDRLRAGSNIVGSIIEDSASLFLNDDFFMTIDVVLGAGKTSDVGSKAALIARNYRLPVEQAWREALVAEGYTAEAADDLVWITNSIVRGLAVRTLWENNPKQFAHVLELWQKIARQYFPLASKPPTTAKKRTRGRA
jgi:AcrR family transcriptional regulator